MVAKLDGRLRDKDMGLELTPRAKNLLARRGYDPVLGARPLRRTIQRDIEDALSEKILFSELVAGQLIVVDVEGDGDLAHFTFEGTEKRLPAVPEPVGVAAEGGAILEGTDGPADGTAVAAS